MDAAESTGLLRVSAVYCSAPQVCDLVELQLPAGATLADAVRASGLCERHALDMAALRAGIWGKLREPAHVLRDGDRIELYRPLRVDPKEARRQRYQQHKDSQEKRKLAKPVQVKSAAQI